MKVLISRHAGIGDIIMSLPVAFHLVLCGHDVTLAVGNQLLDFFSDILKDHDLTVIGATDEMATCNLHCWPGYDRFLNYNRLQEECCFAGAHTHSTPANYQYLMCFIAGINGLSYPRELAPSAYIDKSSPTKTGGILIFPKSLSKNRRIGNIVLAGLLDGINPCASVVDDYFKTNGEFLSSIASARAVICPDSGTAHIAEITHTPCICLLNTADDNLVYRHYKFVKTFCSKAKCSPCYEHFDCNENKCQDDYDIEEIVQYVNSL